MDYQHVHYMQMHHKIYVEKLKILVVNNVGNHHLVMVHVKIDFVQIQY